MKLPPNYFELSDEDAAPFDEAIADAILDQLDLKTTSDQKIGASFATLLYRSSLSTA